MVILCLPPKPISNLSQSRFYINMIIYNTTCIHTQYKRFFPFSSALLAAHNILIQRSTRSLNWIAWRFMLGAVCARTRDVWVCIGKWYNVAVKRVYGRGKKYNQRGVHTRIAWPTPLSPHFIDCPPATPRHHPPATPRPPSPRRRDGSSPVGDRTPHCGQNFQRQ